MVTTIQVSESLQKELNRRKIFNRESYEEVIWDMIEDTMELSEETKRDIEKSRREIREGRVHTLSEAKKRLGL
jgi:hypothetical protein